MQADSGALFEGWSWRPPAHWMQITTIDMHTGGEPLRVITSGLPAIPGRTVLEKRRYFREHYDHLRTGLMWEPRGHADMYGAVITRSEEADFDVFFLHNEGYSTMCGHAIIALTKLVLESGLARRPGKSPTVVFNAPAGIVRAQAAIKGGEAHQISFRNVPSFVYLHDQQIEVPGIGRVRFDVAYGGAFYAIVEARALALQLDAGHYSQLIDYGRRVKDAISAQYAIAHPFHSDLSFLYGTIFTGPAARPEHHSRNVTIFAEGEVDRSSTGTGVSARAALHYARGELRLNDQITIESILGSTLTVCAAEQATFGPHKAILPEVGGMACFTGQHEFYFDPNDTLASGFIFR